jgi:hypothetical protein
MSPILVTHVRQYTDEETLTILSWDRNGEWVLRNCHGGVVQRYVTEDMNALRRSGGRWVSLSPVYREPRTIWPDPLPMNKK